MRERTNLSIIRTDAYAGNEGNLPAQLKPEAEDIMRTSVQPGDLNDGGSYNEYESPG